MIKIFFRRIYKIVVRRATPEYEPLSLVQLDFKACLMDVSSASKPYIQRLLLYPFHDMDLLLAMISTVLRLSARLEDPPVHPHTRVPSNSASLPGELLPALTQRHRRTGRLFSQDVQERKGLARIPEDRGLALRE